MQCPAPGEKEPQAPAHAGAGWKVTQWKRHWGCEMDIQLSHPQTPAAQASGSWALGKAFPAG